MLQIILSAFRVHSDSWAHSDLEAHSEGVIQIWGSFRDLAGLSDFTQNVCNFPKLYNHIKLAILALLRSFCVPMYLQFPSLFVPYDVSIYVKLDSLCHLVYRKSNTNFLSILCGKSQIFSPWKNIIWKI